MALDRDEDRFEGKFGKARRALQRRVARSFPDVSAAGSSKRARAAWFNRARGAGKVKLAAQRPAGSQRVIVKFKPVRACARSAVARQRMRHALYVERDGAGRDGDKVEVFDREHERADGAAFVDRCEDDRHHFRVIISPEHGEQLET